jgi:hypothetical protein
MLPGRSGNPHRRQRRVDRIGRIDRIDIICAAAAASRCLLRYARMYLRWCVRLRRLRRPPVWPRPG